MLQALGDLDMPFEDVRGPLSNWVSTPEIQRQMKLRFKAFLDQFKDENGVPVYKHRIRDMCIGKLTARLSFCYADSTAEPSSRKLNRSLTAETSLFITCTTLAAAQAACWLCFGSS